MMIPLINLMSHAWAGENGNLATDLIDMDNSTVSIVVKGKKETEELSFYRGEDLELAFHLVFKETLPASSSVVLFSSQLKDIARPLPEPTGRIKQVLTRLLGKLGLKKKNPIVKVSRLDFRDDLLAVKTVQQIQTPVSHVSALTTPLAGKNEPSRKPYVIHPFTQDMTDFHFDARINSCCVNTAEPGQDVMWLTLQHAEKGQYGRISLFFPEDLLGNMVSLTARPSSIAMDLDTISKNREWLTVKFYKTNGSPVKISPDFKVADVSFLKVKQEIDTECAISFDRTKLKQLLNQSHKDKAYFEFCFKDETTRGRLRTILPVLVRDKKQVSIES